LFSYGEGSPDGPQNWGKLSPAYKACGQGKQQSPIDIVTKQAVPNAHLDSLNRTYSAVSATLINDGHDITVRVDGLDLIDDPCRLAGFVNAYTHAAGVRGAKLGR